MLKARKADILLAAMKEGIHPKIHKNCLVTCVCGNSFETISTRENITADICSSCHPFYTGQQKFVDTEGRIDKFIKKQKISEDKKKKASATKKTKAKKRGKKEKAPTLKEMLEKARKQAS